MRPSLRRAAPVEVEGGFRYRAFLSYRTADEPLARWLHGRLERYRVPRGLVGKPGQFGPIPPAVGRVFRDRDEARTSEDVETIIAGELSRSQQLVVLCTPRAADPAAWVGREIELFRARRPGGRIHAVIGDGEPPTCFPRQLVSVDGEGRIASPLAADLRSRQGGGRDGRDRALVKVVAGLIGADFDDLWQRERRRARQRTALAAVASTLLLVVAASAGWWSLDRVQRDAARAVAAAAEQRLAAADPTGALRLAAASARLTGVADASARQVAFRVGVGRRASRAVGAVRGRVASLVVAPGGARAVAITDSGAASLWDLEARRAIGGPALPVPVSPRTVVPDETIAAAFSPDGRRFALRSRQSVVSVWDAATGRIITSFEAEYVDGLRFSDDGTRLTTFAYPAATVWDATTGRAAGRLDWSAAAPDEVGDGAVPFKSFALYAGGRRMVLATAGKLGIYDVAAGRRLAERPLPYELHEKGTYHLHFVDLVVLPGDSAFALADDAGVVHLWTVDPLQERGTLRGLTTIVNSLTVSHDGAWLAGADTSGRASLWRLDTDAHVPVIARNGDEVWRLAFSPDDRRLLGVSGGRARVWRLDGRELPVWSAERDSVTAAAFLPAGGEVLLAGTSGRLWTSPYSAAGAIAGAELSPSPSGRRAVTYLQRDGALVLWDLASGREISRHRVAARPRLRFLMDFTPDESQYAYADEGGAAYVVDAASGRAVLTVPATRGTSTYRVRFAPGGRELLVARGAVAELWSVAARKRVVAFPHRESVLEVAFTADGTRLLTRAGYTDGTGAMLWGIRGDTIAELKQPRGYVWRADLSPAGHWVATSNGDTHARLWDARTGALVGELPVERGADEPLRTLGPSEHEFSPDGEWLLLAYEHGERLRLRRTADGSAGAAYDHGVSAPRWGKVRATAFEPNGSRLAGVFEDGTVRLLDLATGAERGTLRVAGFDPRRAVFSPDGRWLAALGPGSVILWDPSTGSVVAELPDERGSDDRLGDWSAAFSADARYLSVARPEGNVVWDLTSLHRDPAAVVDAICGAAPSADPALARLWLPPASRALRPDDVELPALRALGAAAGRDACGGAGPGLLGPVRAGLRRLVGGG